MKRITMTAPLALVLVWAFWSRPVVSQDERAAGGKAPDAEAMKAMMEGMKKWMDSIKPGQQHKNLEHFVGEWDTTTMMWMGGPGTPPAETKGSSDVKWIMGKRFILEEMKGETLMPDPKNPMEMKKIPYEGMGVTGYDNARNVFQSIWLHNVGTNILTMTGSADPSGKVMRSYGEMDEPMLGVVGRTVKYVTKIVDDDKHVFEIFDLHAGDDYKVLEIVYTRKK